MCPRLVFIGFTLLASAVLAAALSVAALAQPAPPRVVQGSDGSLYVVQGANAWPLVPDQIDDAELGALNLGAEVDGTLPASLLTASAPAAPPAEPARASRRSAPTAPATCGRGRRADAESISAAHPPRRAARSHSDARNGESSRARHLQAIAGQRGCGALPRYFSCRDCNGAVGRHDYAADRASRMRDYAHLEAQRTRIPVRIDLTDSGGQLQWAAATV